MKRKTTLIIFTIFALLIGSQSYAQEYTDVLHRLNTGGYLIEETTLDWENDAFGTPSTHLSTENTEVFKEEENVQIAMHASVPSGVPDSVFYYERNLGTSTSDSLQYNFPVAAGRELKINLFFAENYHTAAGLRVFDIVIDHVLVLDNYDVFAQVGGNTGVMQSFTVVSDGNVDIDLVQVTERPMINGIEILAVPEVTTGNQVATVSNFTLAPNPVRAKLELTGAASDSEFTLVSATGQQQTVQFTKTANGYSADASSLEKGVYLLYIHSADTREVLRLIKE